MAGLRRSLIIRLLGRFNYAQKFLIISILFAISIIVSAYFMLVEQNANIAFTEKELLGVQYERALIRLLEDLVKHKILTYNVLTDRASSKNEITNLGSDISNHFKNLIALEYKIGDSLATNVDALRARQQLSLQTSEMQRQWENIEKLMFERSSVESNRLHDQLIHEIYELCQYVGETSNLVLDPGVESNYLMMTLVQELPRFQVLISSIITTGEDILLSENVTQEQLRKMIELNTLLNENVTNTKSIMDEEIQFAKLPQSQLESITKLNGILGEYFDAVQDLLNFMESKLMGGEKKAGTPLEFISLSMRAFQSSFVLWHGVADQFEVVLNSRLASYKKQQRLSLFSSLICAVIGFSLGYIIMREISKPLNDLVEAAKHFASGDLSARVPISYKDEVGQVGIAFNQMAESFQDLIGQLQWTGIQLTTSTTEIAAAAKEQEATVVEQEATTKQIAVTAREIATTAKEFAKTMNNVSNTAEQTSALASSGKAGLTRMESIMHLMVEASQNIASKLAVLNDKAGNITSIITTISKVADQTNLLSLNAAIEAEKAGEHGRSFAVIAREIRRLADQTASATLDIDKTVNEMVSAVSAGVMGVDKFSEEIHTGVGQVTSVSEQLSLIIEQVQQQTTGFENVNKGMQAQSLGAEQIDESIKQLSEGAQQTTESIRQFHNAIEQLNNAAQDMQSAVSKLKR